MNTSQKIKALRKEMKLSQKELADMIGVTQSSIYCWEKGTRKPKLEQLIKLSKVLCIPLDYFGIMEVGLEDGTTNLSFHGDDNDLLAQSKTLSSLMQYLDSLGYTFVDGSFYDSTYDEVGMIQIKHTNIEIPLTLIEFEALENAIAENIELELYRLMKKKNILIPRYTQEETDT